ncbi:568_t:CDS:2 [Gigaspora margarita]|uniref:568_t:CDS:1 n=1 Tax=Gigaspora margarita TaxID=4874 RepID=A0ABN7UJL0_GIGMA|nr:568_t:CDS:2 [Gigaspora margarita]
MDLLSKGEEKSKRDYKVICRAEKKRAREFKTLVYEDYIDKKILEIER